MKNTRIVLALTLVLAFALPALAQEGTFTVSKSVAIPHAVLAPGTYTFKQMGSSPVVAISDANGHKIGMYLTIPASRSSRPETTDLTLRSSRVEAIHFAESELNLQFIYPTEKKAVTAGF